MIYAAEPAHKGGPRPLIGRDRELSRLDGLVANVGVRGSALVISGEPGIGKSALLAVAAARARDSGMFLCSAVGAESEAQLAFPACTGCCSRSWDTSRDFPCRSAKRSKQPSE